MAKQGVKVIVRAGTYLETIDLLGKSIEINGLNPGDPTWPVGLEPAPNGNRINVGAYGNTSQASMSPAN